MNFKKLSTIVVSGVLTLSCLTACGGTTQDASKPNDTASGDKKVLTVAAEAFFQSQEPTTDWVGWDVLKQGAGEMLVKYTADGGIKPWLAESWSVAEDGLTWTVVLRDDVVFSNGEKMTATKVKESIERTYELTDPANGGGGYPADNFTYTDLIADDDANTITIVTTAPTPDLPECLAYPWLMIVDAEACKDVDTKKMGAITTGPYYVTAVENGISTTLLRNENYWAGTPYFDEVDILVIEETSLSTMALIEGDIDFAPSMLAADKKLLDEHDNATYTTMESPRLTYGNFNLNGIFGNKALRQAVLMSIDNESISANVTENTHAAGFSPIPYSLGYEPTMENPYAYNPEGAKKILDDAGIVDTDGDGIRELDGENLEFTYEVAAARMQDIMAQAQAANMAEIGLKCNVVVVQDAIATMTNRQFDIAGYTEVVTPSGDPGRFLVRWYSGAGNNYCGYSNPDYDALYEKLIGEFDPAIRRDLILEMQDILIEDALLIIDGYMNYAIGYNVDLVGADFTPSNLYWVTETMALEQ